MATNKSIEEKAKAYDETLERARKELQVCGSTDCEAARQIFRLFPELKESEDERTRESLLEYLHTLPNHYTRNGVCVLEWIAWIEKQVQKSAKLAKGENYGIDGLHAAIDILQQTLGKVDGYQTDDGILLHECAISAVKQLYEQKPAWSEKDKNMLEWVIGYLENKMLNTPISEERTACKNAIDWLLEKQGEQKPDDKVEPKFKVGDWVVCCNYEPEQIIGIRTNVYEMSNGDIRPFYMIDNNHNIRLWTIQDAKDGDVLATLNQILIFEKILHKDGGVSHCHYDFGCSTPQFNFNKDDNWYFGKEAKVYPATKEQCDLLFSEMKEAGYEWDAEKKKLKKIEQKPAAWSKKDARLLDNCISLIEDIDCTEEEQNWLKTLKYRLQPQPQWSKEDETKIKSIIALLKNPAVCAMDGNKGIIDASIKYLKSLKDRVQPQPKQEWSEEDDRMIKSIIALCDEKMKSTLYQNVIDHAINTKNWLKSLKYRVQPQSQWKPSEQDILLLERIFDGKLDPKDFQASLLSIIGQLKKLREE